MRHPLTLLASALCLACGGTTVVSEPCPPTSSSVAGAEAPEASAGSAVIESLDGRWFVLERASSDVDSVLDIAGHAGTADPGHDPQVPLRVSRRPDGIWKLEFETDGNRMRVLLVPRSADAALGFPDGGDEAFLARRARALPTWLTGSWEVASPAGGRLPFSAAEISGASGRVTQADGRSVEIELAGLGAEGGVEHLAYRSLEDGDWNWIRFQRVSDDVALMLPPGTDEFLVIHRVGARPVWLTEPASEHPAVRDTPVVRPPG